MLKIQRATDGTITVLTVSGRLDADNINQLRQSLDILPEGDAVALDLADLLLADREAIRFLATARPPGKSRFGTVRRTFEHGWKIEVFATMVNTDAPGVRTTRHLHESRHLAFPTHLASIG
jgi:hypothetical protein